MTFLELCRRLSIGELSNLSMSGSGSGTIKTEKHPVVALYANTALDKLFSRFNMKEGRLLLQTLGSRDMYPLRSEHTVTAQLAGGTEDAFILDSVTSPFLNNVLKILDVSDEEGTNYALNIEYDQWSLYTPEPDVLQIPFPMDGLVLSVGYQAKHPELTGESPETEQINIPRQLVPALTAHIAHEVYGAMNSAESVAISQNHLTRYEMICQDLEAKDVLSTSWTAALDRFTDRGFV